MGWEFMITMERIAPVAQTALLRAAETEIRPITGLRAIAVLSVLFYHVDKSLIERGFLGVDLFFVISGFVVATSAFRRPAPTPILAFYYARLRRIFPALVTMIILTLAASYFLLLPPPFVDTANQATATLLIRANYFFYETTNYFADAATSRIFLHTWSLSVEEQFYLAFPLILFIRNRLIIGAIAAVACALSFHHSFSLIAAGDGQLAFYGIGSRCWQFSLGLIGAIIANSRYAIRKNIANGPAQLLGIAIILACLFAPSSFGHNLKTQAALSIAALLFLILSTQETSANAIMSLRPLRFFGLISYSLYLYHWPVIVFLRMYIEDPRRLAAGAMLISTTLATASYYSVETFFRRSPIWTIPHWPRLVGAASATSAAALIACFFVIRTDGVPSRLPKSAKMALAAKVMSPEFHKCFDPPGTDFEVSIPEMAALDKLCRLGPAECD
ncbi:peptidoglycan/LPS O-acetylase OafA/YrhL [Bradyrhizobium sp. S3.14.4]